MNNEYPRNGNQSTLGENLRTLRIASWLGWQIESNWADPFLFLILNIFRPLAIAMTVFVMYEVIAGGKRDDFFDYLYLSNALFVIVTQVLVGLSWTVFEDRENYQMLKYIYTSPAAKYSYLLGRASAKVAIGIITLVILLLFGVLFLRLSIDITKIEWLWLAAYSVIGIVILLSMGIVLAGIALILARNGEFIGEVTAGVLLLVCSVYYPPDILPSVLRWLSLAMPITYWLEGMRRAISGGFLLYGSSTGTKGAVISPILSAFSNGELLLLLAGFALVASIFSHYFYRWIETQAKERGMIDRVTSW